MEMILDVIHDTYIDSLRILPFLFLAYLAMECLEHWTGGKMQAVVRKSGKCLFYTSDAADEKRGGESWGCGGEFKKKSDSVWYVML